MTEADKSSGSSGSSASSAANKPMDAALDLLVFAPLGLALAAAEEIPKLAARGRATVNGQMTMAKMIGQFAVAQGRKEIERRLGGGKAAKPAPQPSAVPDHDAATSTTPYQEAGKKTYESLLGTDASIGTGPSRETTTTTGTPVPGPATGSPAPEAHGLAIPGYDSLSASQVVQRLAGLSQDELAAVGTYEEAHRGRRTILTRVRQLQGG